jgi:hypothetical protein
VKIATGLAAACLALLVAAWSHRAAGPATTPGRSAGNDPAPAARATVLLELFTSEGCSSCPPADRLLEELAGSDLVPAVDVVPLSLHVDYWNHLGWKDPYSDAEFSRRQERYSNVLPAGRVYTPQLVVDGERHLVGSDRRQVLAAIAGAGERRKAAVTLRAAAAEASPLSASWQVSLDAEALSPRPANADLFVAVTEDGLASSVSRGENAGRKLEHVAVVRSLRSLGRIPLDASGHATRDVTIDLDRSWRRDQLHLVAWIADGPQGRVLGAARIAL